jgi:hypothetical protein
MGGQGWLNDVQCRGQHGWQQRRAVQQPHAAKQPGYTPNERTDVHEPASELAAPAPAVVVAVLIVLADGLVQLLTALCKGAGATGQGVW